MGKIKTVVMGDLEAEEKAREKAEVKREEKKKRQEKAAIVEEVPEAAVTTTELEVESKKEEKAKPGEKKHTLASKYRFPAGKKYSAAKSLIDSKKLYSVSDALDLVKKTSYSNFDGSVELHLNVTENGLRGNVSLPHGTGKTLRIKIADETLVKSLENGGKIDFDILVASPEMMGKLTKIAKILGPRGLMPNPKTNTISNNPEKLAKELTNGQLQWKTQPDFPIVHAMIGKVSFENKKLAENFAALTKSIGKDKINSAFIKATMGPSIRVQV